MEWFYLVIAGIFEVGWAIGLKYSQGFTKTLPSIVTIAGMAASFFFIIVFKKSANRYCIRNLDRNRHYRYSTVRHYFV